MKYLAALSIGLVALLLPLWLGRRAGLFLARTRGAALFSLGSGALFGVMAHFVEKLLGDYLAASALRASMSAGVLLLLLIVPLGEAGKVLSVWPHYKRRRLERNITGATFAVLAAAGFAATKLSLHFASASSAAPLDYLRSIVAIPAHYFFAGLWGHMLGGSRRDRHFAWIFLASVALHGVYEYLVFLRGPAYLVIALPMLVMMSLGVLGLNRERAISSRPSSISLFEPSGYESLRSVMRSEGRPLKLHWILLGSLVTLGVMLSLLGLGIYLGLRNGVDFSTVEQAGEGGIVPLALLGTSFLLAFPISAFLIATASGAVSVLEPAWATIVAIVLISVLFGLTDASALLIVVAIAPVGFSLACAGAWFGLSRR